MILVVFDVDGTLVYSERRDSKAFAETYEQIYQEPFPSIDLSTYPHVTDYTIFSTVIRQHFNRNINRDEVKLFQNLFVEKIRKNRLQHPGHFQEVKGAATMIKKLSAHPVFELAIATGGWAAPAKVKLKHVDIDPDPMILVGGDEMPTRDDILTKSISLSKAKSGKKYQKIVYIGDASWDVSTTRNLSLDFIGVRRKGDKESLYQLGAQDVIQDYEDFSHFQNLLYKARSPLD